jgi:hypothetical protein
MISTSSSTRVAVSACELDEVVCSLDDRAALGCACDRDASSAAELEQFLVSEES